MNIRTPKTSISSCHSDRQSTFDWALRRMQNFGVSSIVGGLAGAIGLQVGMVGVLAIGGSLSVQQTVLAQATITNVSATRADAIDQSFATTTANPCDPNVGTCNRPATTSFGTGTSNNLNINSVSTTSGITYTFRKLSNTIIINRLNNANVSGERQLIYFEGIPPIVQATLTASGVFRMLPGAVSTMKTALLNQTINRGSDNVFANNFSGVNNALNYNNIERIDYIITDGITPTTNAELDDIGFVVMDRGANDSYKIAPILTLSSGLPDTFGLPKVHGISTTTNINSLSSSLLYIVTRLESSDTADPVNLRPVDTVSQRIGGNFVSLRDLGITTVGQTVYGYSLLSHSDGPTTAANMKLVSSANYPTNTNFGPTGGFDIVAGGGIFSRNPLPVSTYTLSGNVFNDGNGTKLKDGVGTSEDYTAADITAVLLDSNSRVIKTAAIDSSGNYSLLNVPAGIYTVKIIKTPTTPLVIGETIPVASDILPTNFVPTGENEGNIVAGIDSVVDRTLSVTVATTNITGINFGIEQLPKAVAVAVATQTNPGGTATVNIPIGSFNTSTDPDPDGTVVSYKITAFPSNVTSITIGTTTYTSANFPVGGVTVLVADLGTVKVDPIDGDVTVQIPFKAIDNAGQESANTATIDFPFTVVVPPPQLILLKRITKINGGITAKASNGSTISLTTVVPQPDNLATLTRDESDDSTINISGPTTTPWPTAGYPQGAIDAGVIKTGDLIEYTIYFLSIGGKPVTNANLCDWVPTNTVFEPNSYGVGQGIQLAIGSIINTLTNVPDGDRGVFFNPGTLLPTTYPSGATSLLTCRTPAGSAGAVVVNLVKSTLPAPDNQLPNATAAGTPGNSYGFIRFVSKVK